MEKTLNLDPSKNVPVVNSAGSSRQALVDQQTDVMLSLRNTLLALETATPHPRDFLTYAHVYGKDTPKEYQAERERHGKVVSLIKELEDFYLERAMLLNER
jgi:hypothetical protein